MGLVASIENEYTLCLTDAFHVVNICGLFISSMVPGCSAGKAYIPRWHGPNGPRIPVMTISLRKDDCGSTASNNYSGLDASQVLQRAARDSKPTPASDLSRSPEKVAPGHLCKSRVGGGGWPDCERNARNRATAPLAPPTCPRGDNTPRTESVHPLPSGHGQATATPPGDSRATEATPLAHNHELLGHRATIAAGRSGRMPDPAVLADGRRRSRLLCCAGRLRCLASGDLLQLKD